MYLDQRTKKYLKVFGLIAFVFLLVGCGTNIDPKTGKLLAERAITESTPWSLSAGIFDFLLVIPIAKGILLINDLLGNVLWGVVGMTIVINIITLPVMIKSTKSTQKMQLIQPEMERIQKKYAGRKDQASQMRQSAEIQALYKKHDVSMMGSFVTFITLPLMFAMWQSVQRVEIVYSASFLGLELGATPMTMITGGAWYYGILIAIMAATQFFSMQITQIMLKRSKHYRPSAQQKSMNTMNYVMTAMIIYFALIMPTAMSFYWITTNIITILRTIYIQIYHIEKEEAQKDSGIIK